jgi:glutamate dehydrogenase
LLDLIVSTPTTQAGVVDLLGKQELVYLGPDEQVIPDDINWIVHRAAERGYPIPSAFMSSKPDAGFNHKTYGVTSEGVQVGNRMTLLRGMP